MSLTMTRSRKQSAKGSRPAAAKPAPPRGHVRYLGPPPGERAVSTEQIRKAVEAYFDARDSGK